MVREDYEYTKRLHTVEMAHPSLRSSDGIKGANMWNVPNNPKIEYQDGIGDLRFWNILSEMWSLHCKKGQDYGSKETALGGKDDFLANLRASKDFGIEAWVGALIRANDKMIRLKNAAQGHELANESVEDSLIDLACYAVLSLTLFREMTTDGI